VAQGRGARPRGCGARPARGETRMTAKRIRIVAAAVLVAVLAAAAAYLVLLRSVSVETVTVAEGTVPFRVTGPGTLQARIPVTLSARITATVAALHADQGDAVRTGKLLAVLDDRELAAKRAAAGQSQETVRRNVEAAEAALAKARADLDLARAKHRRDTELFDVGYISRSALDSSVAALRAAEAGLDNAEAVLAARRSEGLGIDQETRYAETVLSHTRVLAPMDGVVIERLTEVGTTVVPGTPLFKLVDPATLWVAVRVDESVAGRLRLGQPARIRLRTGEERTGKVARISHQADAAARELEVNVAFDAPLERFAIDQEAEVSILAGEAKGLVVPIGALVRERGKQGVLVVREGRARFQPVQTAAADTTRVIITEGPRAGERVVARPQGVKAGARVRPLAPGD